MCLSLEIPQLTKNHNMKLRKFPLLFARGSPTSLESMCLEELQVFLRFVLKCEQNLVSVNIDQLDSLLQEIKMMTFYCDICLVQLSSREVAERSSDLRTSAPLCSCLALRTKLTVQVLKLMANLEGFTG